MFFDDKNTESSHLVLFIFGLVVVAPLLGYLMAKIAVYWIKHLYSDVIAEVTVGLTFFYLTFYIGKAFTYCSLTSLIYLVELCYVFCILYSILHRT